MRRDPLGRGWFLLAGCGWFLLLPLVAGCGPGKGTVSGRVLYNKQPVPGGTVTFAPAGGGGSPVSAPIDENGHYEITVPTGEMAISVDNSDLKPLPKTNEPVGLPGLPGLPKGLKAPRPQKGQAPQKEQAPLPASEQEQRPAGKYVAIPPKYYRLDNGLKYKVTSGSQKHDIELK